jgi:hypothetical protein
MRFSSSLLAIIALDIAVILAVIMNIVTESYQITTRGREIQGEKECERLAETPRS